jgi:hypothetical protein
MTTSPPGQVRPEATIRAREVLTAFLFTFIAARVLVYLIMARRMPDLYLHMGGTHVHHLNYGIFLLSFVGAYLIFVRPTGEMMTLAAYLYGIGLALTFDEFGMWLHLGGAYWQRASFDAIVIIAAVLSLLAAAPDLRRLRPHHWFTALLLVLCLGLLGVAMRDAANKVGQRIAPGLQRLEQGQPY